MLTADQIADALREAYTLGIGDGHPLSRGEGRRALDVLIAETVAEAVGDLAPALGGADA